MKRAPRASAARRTPTAPRHESRPIPVDPKLAAREVAFAVVCDVFGEEKRGAQAAFDVRARRAELDGRDRGFAAEIAYGSIKSRRLIDYYLAPYLNERERPVTIAIGEVLRIGVYQLRFMSGVDDHAAVSETVNLAWKHGHKGTAGLVNAVLRRMIADGIPELAVETFKNQNDYFGTKYSMPSWIAGQYVASYPAVAESAMAGVNLAPQHAIRVNGLRSDVATVLEELVGRGIDVVQSPYVPESLIVDVGALGDDPQGRWSVQGEAAAMVVDLLDPKPGETILEMCSGRGNKTVQIAARLGGTGNLVCVEIDDRKIRVLRETLERCDVTDVGIVAGDARTAATEVSADAVLLDAPCSGTGIIGRHPEARWRKAPDDGARLAIVQAELIRAAAARTRAGGRLTYSVCSSDVREGRAVVDAFLSENPDFTRAVLPERYASFARDGDVVVPAGVEGRDGFFIATLVRAA